eukprot:TRINITY_DN4982_c0_g1_i6.p1 TRINITY_DN4982_c0_g1~~TRINITY_DN4982_c0_g1_i6.p1  ORF type:complete len:529 (-),score=78.50 TRINITY_DN4982_c0_g1_i6:177-1676(-)
MAVVVQWLCLFLWQWRAFAEDDCDQQGQVNLLQSHVNLAARRHPPAQGPTHYWPHSRGRAEQYTFTYPMPESLNLTAAHSWTWEHPGGLNGGIIWSTIIDSSKNLYVCDTASIHKLSPDGTLIWQSKHGGENCALDGPALFGMHQGLALMFALDLETGREIWTKPVAIFTGSNGDMVEASNGVVVAGVGTIPMAGDGGRPSARLIGVDSSNGEELWSFKPDCGMWNIMALFPDNETFNFMDQCGGAYRLGLRNGSVIWSKPQNPLSSFTDGGAILDATGDMYTCSSPEGSSGTSGSGVVRKYRGADGQQLWESIVDSPCVNFPAVSADGSTLILAPGGLAADAVTKGARKLQSRQEQEQLYKLQQELLDNHTQRSYYDLPDLEGSILGLDTSNGKVLWQHQVEPWAGVAFALDEERAWNQLNGNGPLPHCWPSHWSGAIADSYGRVYIGRSTGDVYVYNPRTDTEDRFYTGDGILMGGMSSAPGMLVVSTCSFVHAFKF